MSLKYEPASEPQEFVFEAVAKRHLTPSVRGHAWCRSSRSDFTLNRSDFTAAGVTLRSTGVTLHTKSWQEFVFEAVSKRHLTPFLRALKAKHPSDALDLARLLRFRASPTLKGS